jgi:hypothetical protein
MGNKKELADRVKHQRELRRIPVLHFLPGWKYPGLCFPKWEEYFEENK